MSNEYWSVKRNAYAALCITNDYHGTVTVWDTRKKQKTILKRGYKISFQIKLKRKDFILKKFVMDMK